MFMLLFFEDHKILNLVASKISRWDDIRTLGLQLNCDPDYIDGLCTGTQSVNTAAYEILRSFYNQNNGPAWQMWGRHQACHGSPGEK